MTNFQSHSTANVLLQVVKKNNCECNWQRGVKIFLVERKILLRNYKQNAAKKLCSSFRTCDFSYSCEQLQKQIPEHKQ